MHLGDSWAVFNWVVSKQSVERVEFKSRLDVWITDEKQDFNNSPNGQDSCINYITCVKQWWGWNAFFFVYPHKCLPKQNAMVQEYWQGCDEQRAVIGKFLNTGEWVTKERNLQHTIVAQPDDDFDAHSGQNINILLYSSISIQELDQGPWAGNGGSGYCCPSNNTNL